MFFSSKTENSGTSAGRFVNLASFVRERFVLGRKEIVEVGGRLCGR